MTTEAPTEPLYTVEEASRWLTCAQPVPLPLLQKLGKDCSLVSRIWRTPKGTREVTGKKWTTEYTYTAAVIREVFGSNPDTRDFLPPIPAAPEPQP